MTDVTDLILQENSLLTYAVSAKSGEGLGLCFQKIVAEILGIRYSITVDLSFLFQNDPHRRLSKAEQEQQQTVVRAEIVTQRPDRIQANPQSNVKTTVCSIQ
jgi:Ras-related protein Rab-28